MPAFSMAQNKIHLDNLNIKKTKTTSKLGLVEVFVDKKLKNLKTSDKVLRMSKRGQ